MPPRSLRACSSEVRSESVTKRNASRKLLFPAPFLRSHEKRQRTEPDVARGEALEVLQRDPRQEGWTCHSDLASGARLLRIARLAPAALLSYAISTTLPTWPTTRKGFSIGAADKECRQQCPRATASSEFTPAVAGSCSGARRGPRSARWRQCRRLRDRGTGAPACSAPRDRPGR